MNPAQNEQVKNFFRSVGPKGAKPIKLGRSTSKGSKQSIKCQFCGKPLAQSLNYNRHLVDSCQRIPGNLYSFKTYIKTQRKKVSHTLRILENNPQKLINNCKKKIQKKIRRWNSIA